MNEHTPGPWKEIIDPDGYVFIVGPDYELVYDKAGVYCYVTGAVCAIGDMENTDQKDHVNARLIVAAPDGYVIAERLVKSVKYWAKHEKYAACPICEGYRISEAAYEHGDLCPAFLAEKYLALVDKETR